MIARFCPARMVLAVLVFSMFAQVLSAQQTGLPIKGTIRTGWRSQQDVVLAGGESDRGPMRANRIGTTLPADGAAGQHRTVAHAVTRVTEGSGVLPNDHGQVWREYDITPYTSQVTNTDKPQQAVIDWVLRETGTEIWFSEPVGLLSANRQKLRVYHTPQIQKLVSGVVDRFVGSRAESRSFGVRLATVESPNWRTKALRYLQPVNVRTAGIEAWLLSKEDAALLVAELSRRTDYREHNTSNLLIHNGQSSTISMLRPKSFTRSIRMHGETWPGYQMVGGQINEGCTLRLEPLMSLDAKTVDAVIRCNIDQVERFVPVAVNVPSSTAPRQQEQIQVPQMVSWRLHERFRWPADHVLLISAGVVATPGVGKPTNRIGFSNLLAGGPARADGLLFVEHIGKSRTALVQPTKVPQAPRTGGVDNRGRY